MLRAFAIAVLAMLPGSASAGLGDIHPTALPTELIAPADTVTLRWAESLSCLLWTGHAPGQPDTEIARVHSLPGELSFVPEAGGLGAGAWYAQLVDLGGTESSLPFLLFVEAPNAPVMVAPQNGGEVAPGSVRLTWEPVLGVPYYHVILSDQPILLEENDEGETVIAGANIIWQAIVPETGADYGSWDPSDFFNAMNGTPPPLVPGPEYNWLVLNNYGNNPALTSTRQAGVSSFSVLDDSGLDPPALIEPAADDSLAAATIAFRWSEVSEANHYHFTLSRILDSDENEGAMAVFDQISGQTLLDLPAASLLVESRYQWKVFALDATGQGVASESREFHYSIPMGHLAISTRDETGAALPHVQVELIPLGGTGSALPVVTGNGGNWDDDLVPGAYQLVADKEGYEPASGQIAVTADADSALTLVLPTSPATFAGEVRNGEQVPVPFATVTAAHELTGELRETQCGPGGEFQLGVSAGTWALTAAKIGHHADGPVAAIAEPGAWHDLPAALILLPNTGSIGGSVLGTSGLPIVGALVSVAGDTGGEQILTGSDGVFLFSLDAGTWTLSASKPGFVSPPPRALLLSPDEDLTLDPPLVLGAEASLLSGFVLAGGGVVGGATVEAVPAVGSPVSAVCGGQGDWQLSLAAGSWQLSARRAGYSALDTLQLNLEPGSSQSGLNLILIAHPSTVSGMVSDGQNPISGANVSGGGSSTVSSWTGSYSLSLPAGLQSLEAWAEGFSSPTPILLELAPGQDIVGIDFQLSPNAATLSGHVRSDGEPVAAAALHLVGIGVEFERSSDAQGAYSFGAPPGTYQLWAHKEGMVGADTLTIDCGPGQVLPDRDFELFPATATLFGRVRGDGELLRDAQISATSASGTIATASGLDGGWSLRVPGGSSWEVTVSADGYHDGFGVTPTLGVGETWSEDFDLPLQLATLNGRIVEPGGTPIPGASIEVAGQGSALSDDQGTYSLGLLPGSIEMSVSAAGYAEHTATLALPVGITELDVNLELRFASLSGTIRDAGGQTLPGVLLTAPGASALSDEAGAYAFPRLVADLIAVRAELAGYESKTQTLSLAELQAGSLDFVLPRLTGSLAGQVRDLDGLPLVGALVQVSDGGILLAQSYSASDGAFAIGSLPIDRPLSLGASLADHASGPGNPRTDLWAPLADLELALAQLDGTIAGRVLDAETQAPIANAILSAADGAGYFGQANSDEAGYFSIGGLRNGAAHSLQADAAGWAETSLAGVLPGQAELELLLTPAPARILVTLQPERNDLAVSLPAGTLLRGLPDEPGVSELSLTIDEFGAFELNALQPGAYTLLFQVDGHLTVPRSLNLVLAEGETLGPFAFELVAAPLVELSINGLGELDNDASAVYRSSQSTGSAEQVQFPLVWSLDPPGAGNLNPETGRFTPRASFFGEARIAAQHAASGLRAEIPVSIFARLATGESRELDDGRGLGLSLPAGALIQDQRITVRRREASPVKRRAGDYRVEGDLIRFLPDGLVFQDTDPPTLALPIPNPLFNADLALGWWDPRGLRWELLSGEKSSRGLLRELEHFSDYALLVANSPLGIGAAAVSPNPFSPADGGADIRFTLSSQSMSAPIVDVTVYNLLGDPVRRLLEHAALAVGSEHTLHWDGLSEAGELARNGRYLVRIQARDGNGEEDIILQAVLIK